MGFVSLWVLVAVSLDVAAKCDVYVVGSVYHHTNYADSEASFQGCKKGCFYNATFTDDGVRKCEKCSEIKDEIECRNHTSTCQWTKSGKCSSQSCPNIAKVRVTTAQTSGGFVDDNTDVRTERYRKAIVVQNECISGSAQEQEHANRYFQDYKEKQNLRYVQSNCNPNQQVDQCHTPCSVGWEAGNAADGTKAKCENGKFGGCTYTPVNTDGTLNAGDTCLPKLNTNFSCAPWTAGTNTGKECLLLGNDCEYFGEDPGDGSQLSTSDRCYYSFANAANAPCYPFTAGTTTKAACESLGCTFAPVPTCKNPCGFFIAGTHTKATCESWFGGCKYTGADPTGNLHIGDTCLPTAGIYACPAWTGGRRDCELLGCTYGYKGGDTCTVQLTDGVQQNAKCHGSTAVLATGACNALGCVSANNAADTDITLTGACGTYQTKCTVTNREEFITEELANYQCRTNESLSITGQTTDQGISLPVPNKFCDDRVYGNIPKTLRKACRGITSTGPGTTLPDLVRQKCIWDRTEELSSTVHVDGVTTDANGVNTVKGDLRPATIWENCVETQKLVKDPYGFKPITGTGTRPDVPRNVAIDITNENRKILYGFNTAEEYCDYVRDFYLENTCEKDYKTAVAACSTNLVIDEAITGGVVTVSVTTQQLSPSNLVREHVEIMAERSACHRMYGCMYSRSNERCSVWSIWAFILTLVLTIVVFVAALVVVGVLVLPKLRKSAA